MASNSPIAGSPDRPGFASTRRPMARSRRNARGLSLQRVWPGPARPAAPAVAPRLLADECGEVPSRRGGTSPGGPRASRRSGERAMAARTGRGTGGDRGFASEDEEARHYLELLWGAPATRRSLHGSGWPRSSRLGACSRRRRSSSRQMRAPVCATPRCSRVSRRSINSTGATTHWGRQRRPGSSPRLRLGRGPRLTDLPAGRQWTVAQRPSCTRLAGAVRSLASAPVGRRADGRARLVP